MQKMLPMHLPSVPPPLLADEHRKAIEYAKLMRLAKAIKQLDEINADFSVPPHTGEYEA